MQSDHTSAVAQYSFGDTLPEQEVQLRTNPLLQRFKTARQAKADDPVRPKYHFCNPDGRLNDPNGLCFCQGRWHLFYQAFPPEDPRPHWAHAVSDDLIHWRDLPYAIYPHPEHGCWSGASLVDQDRVIVHYYGHQIGNVSAISRDPLLLNWQKVPGGIPEPKTNEPSQSYRVYDPCIWKKNEAYYSLSGGTLPTGPRGLQRRANFLFRSEDQLAGNAIELSLEVETNGAPLIELDVLRSPDQQEYTRPPFSGTAASNPLSPVSGPVRRPIVRAPTAWSPSILPMHRYSLRLDRGLRRLPRCSWRRRRISRCGYSSTKASSKSL